LSHDGHTFSEDEAKADIVFNYYNSLLGTPFTRQHRIDLSQLQLTVLDLSTLVEPFTAEEVAGFVKATPSDRAPGPYGFTGAFFKAAWEVIGADVVRVFNAFWELDHRSFNHLNEAAMVLIHKTDSPASLGDYRPISLIHSVGKLIAKGLAISLAPFMTSIVKPNQSAFIRGRQIHKNFRTVQLTCKWLHGLATRRCS
jgi:hypothetical protein